MTVLSKQFPIHNGYWESKCDAYDMLYWLGENLSMPTVKELKVINSDAYEQVPDWGIVTAKYADIASKNPKDAVYMEWSFGPGWQLIRSEEWAFNGSAMTFMMLYIKIDDPTLALQFKLTFGV